MGKRLTETTKWDDPWFVELLPQFKLAWLYVCDCCDVAGIIQLSPRLANLRIGQDVDWNAFVNATDGRIEQLAPHKFRIVGFIKFQYGELKKGSQIYRGVEKAFIKNGLSPEGLPTLQDKDKDKDKDLDKDLDWEVPERLDTPTVRGLLAAFSRMRRKIGKPIRDVRNTSMILNRFQSVEHLTVTLELCIANEWQGIKPEYGIDRSGKVKSSVKPKPYVDKTVRANNALARKVDAARDAGASPDEIQAIIRQFDEKMVKS